jgi:hypothetical protein
VTSSYDSRSSTTRLCTTPNGSGWYVYLYLYFYFRAYGQLE